MSVTSARHAGSWRGGRRRPCLGASWAWPSDQVELRCARHGPATLRPVAPSPFACRGPARDQHRRPVQPPPALPAHVSPPRRVLAWAPWRRSSGGWSQSGSVGGRWVTPRHPPTSDTSRIRRIPPCSEGERRYPIYSQCRIVMPPSTVPSRIISGLLMICPPPCPASNPGRCLSILRVQSWA